MSNMTMSDSNVSETSSTMIQTSQTGQMSTDLAVSDTDSQKNTVVLLSANEYWRARSIMDPPQRVLEVLGILLNITNIIILTRKSMRNPTTTFLAALSILQIIYIVFSLIPVIHKLYKPLVFTDFFYLINSIYFINYVMTCLRRSIYCLQCYVSMERLLAVMVPLKAKQFLLVRRPLIFIMVTPVVVFLTHIDLPFKMEVYPTSNTKNETIYSFRYSQHYLQNSQHYNNLGITTKILFVYLTLLVLLVTNLTMITMIRRYAAVRRNMTTNQDTDAARRQESQMTMTILVSTLIFVVLCLPKVCNSLTYNVLPKSYGPFSSHGYLFLFINRVGALLFTLTFSTDFFTYVCLSTMYRNTLLRMLKRGKKQEALFSTNGGSKTI